MREQTLQSFPALPRRLRVLLTTDTVGGVWTFALELVRALERHGAEVLLATMGRDLDAAQREAILSFEHCTVYESAFRLEWMEDPWEDVDHAGKWLLALEAEWDPDVVHCNTLAHAGLPWRAPVILTVHSCVYSWFHAVKGEPPPDAEWNRYFHCITTSLRRADALVTPTAAMRSALEIYPGGGTRARVIPNGRSPALFSPLSEKQERLLAAGRLWDEGKNIALLQSIAEELSWPLLIAGETAPEQSEAVSASPHFLGYLSACEMAEQLASAAVFVHPALYEPFGLAPLEAALSRCALVLGDIPSLREVWGDDNALFIDPTDENAWIAAIEWLIAKPHRWRAYGERAYHRAQQFSADQMGGAYFNLYTQARSPAHEVSF